MRRIKSQRAFTLIELLVVLAIIGILIGLAVGGIRIVQQVNRDTQRKALVRDIQLVLEAYQERKNKYPPASILSIDDNDVTGKVDIEAGDDVVYSEAYFDIAITIADAACVGYTPAEELDSGKITGCYQEAGQGYYLIINLERTAAGYDVSTAV